MQTTERVGNSPRAIEKPSDWFYEDGVGFLPLTGREVPYDAAYFANYQRLAATEQGKLITNLRADLVDRWCGLVPYVLDVGIGCGSFIQEMARRGYGIFGDDINPVAIKWLEDHNYSADSDYNQYNALTFWDVLEHMPNASDFIGWFTPKWIFLSMPIYRDEEHIFQSKHYKPGEHCWYFTVDGLQRFMKGCDYEVAEINSLEINPGGREDVWAFAFRRVN